jgi:enoyl-[acyl-carrier-protein] reductase (NADH)
VGEGRGGGAFRTPLGRRLDPEKLGPPAVSLASDSAAAIIGQALNIDGGVLMTG